MVLVARRSVARRIPDRPPVESGARCERRPPTRPRSAPRLWRGRTVRVAPRRSAGGGGWLWLSVVALVVAATVVAAGLSVVAESYPDGGGSGEVVRVAP
ncbi:hypothetical protein SacazDRAFT_01469 [Saccharomonospora azurea NA-128]|uniref:Uncharacterized protein n=1 Tax=Saccharomonospora azurea NA-128 TaxID=882081 RepID=H8G802_9PSEU|nr:hypothetical protein SacazDRAFT_01469 [Saccharomonospora azurea NA-128]